MLAYMNFNKNPLLTTELAALECLKIDVSTVSRQLLILSFLNLQLMRIFIIWII